MLPRSVDALDQRTCQNQLIVDTSHDLCPALCLFWRVQAWLIPQQHLLIEPIAMLMRIAQTIGRADFGQRSGFIPFPNKPTDLGIAPTLPCRMADDLDQADFDPAGRAQMQLVPAMDFYWMAFGIRPDPTGTRKTC